MQYDLKPQYGKGHVYFSGKAKGYFCEPCQLFFEEGPAEKPHYGRDWNGDFCARSHLAACDQCGMALKIAFKPQKNPPKCVTCGHEKQWHRKYHRQFSPCNYNLGAGQCDCEIFLPVAPKKWEHIAHKFIRTLNGNFRGVASNGLEHGIAYENGYAIFLYKPEYKDFYFNQRILTALEEQNRLLKELAA